MKKKKISKEGGSVGFSFPYPIFFFWQFVLLLNLSRASIQPAETCSALPYSAFRIKAYSPPVLKRQSSVLGFSFFDLIEFNMLCRAVSNCRELRQRPYRALVRDPGCLILISMRQSGSIRLVTCPALRSSLLPRFVIMMSCLATI